MTSREIDQLIVKTAQGDVGALERLYSEMKTPVFFYALQLSCNQHIAEDVMQDTFVSIMSSCRSYVPKGNGRAWIITIVKNRVLDLLKKSKPLFSIDLIANQERFSYLIDTPFEEHDSFMEILQPLNKKERDIIIFRVLVGLTLTQIADEMALPKGSVFWTYNNAMKKLKKSLTTAKEKAPCTEK